MSFVTGLFFLVLLLNQRWSPPLPLQASHCSTFRIMCDVPSTAVFCTESIECLLGIASKFFLKLLLTIPVAPVITGLIVHFRFHIPCISIHKLLYFNFFTASFCTTFLYVVITIIIIIIIIRSRPFPQRICFSADSSLKLLRNAGFVALPAVLMLINVSSGYCGAWISRLLPTCRSSLRPLTEL